MKKLFCLFFMFSFGLSVLSESNPCFAVKTAESIPGGGCVETDGPCIIPPLSSYEGSQLHPDVVEFGKVRSR